MMRHNKRKGFSLAELLMVVAIIGILAGVSFIAVNRYQKSLLQLERDNLAQEIFVAAQNHLTMAESQGAVEQVMSDTASSYKMGKKETGSSGIYYFVVNNDSGVEGTSFNSAGNMDEDTLLDYMLPFGSLDDTVRLGGSYIIRYQADPALILDVFYCTQQGRYPGTFSDFAPNEYSSFISQYEGINKKNDRLDYNGAIIGWYGGEKAIVTGAKLIDPEIEVSNAERLSVSVKNPNEGEDLRVCLVVTGETSGAKWLKPLEVVKTEQIVILDDITKGKEDHFAENVIGMKQSGDDVAVSFIPGENIIIRVEVSNTQKLTNVATSNSVMTNSLFADLTSEEVGHSTVSIANFRHLENLDKTVSNLDDVKLKISKAVQIEDLSWDQDATSFCKIIGDNVQISAVSNGGKLTEANQYHPIFTEGGYALEYDGQGHVVKNVSIKTSQNAGLFAHLVSPSKVSDLQLQDFSVENTGVGSAGSLAGQSTNATITNVVARNLSNSPSATITSTSGAAGGLIGSMSGGTVDKCAAALVVSGKTDAGGLIGSVSGGRVTDSYSGGHTKDGRYDLVKGDDGDIIYNVKASAGNAGGLVGSASEATISGSYSTCSASGTSTAGGLAGTMSGGGISASYATGLIDKTAGATAGAFMGKVDGVTIEAGNSNHYYDIINEYSDEEGLTQYLQAIGSEPDNSTVTAIDADVNAYNMFVSLDRPKADPYDPVLRTYYNGDYPLKGISGVASSDLVSVHYGDWPAPETFVVNTPG